MRKANHRLLCLWCSAINLVKRVIFQTCEELKDDKNVDDTFLWEVREVSIVYEIFIKIDPNHKLSQWKMARVIATYPGNDGLVRKTRIKTQEGEYDRPIHKLSFSNKR